MNITLAFQELDDLIIKHTPLPARVTLRNKLHLLRDQVEAYIDEKEKIQLEHTKLIEKHEALKLVQTKESPDLVSNMGVFWKRTATGFEQIPYCGECAHHPIMTPVFRAKIYVCSNGHQAPIYVEPPK